MDAFLAESSQSCGFSGRDMVREGKEGAGEQGGREEGALFSLSLSLYHRPFTQFPGLTQAGAAVQRSYPPSL